MKTVTLAFLFSSFIVTAYSYAASIEKAIMLNQHGLQKEAKAELIDVIFSKSDNDKAQAYYLLGSIAFEENRVTVALNTWRNLIDKYPKSEQAIIVNGKINELTEIVDESDQETIQNAVALSYLRHGDFWSKGKDNIFNIDASWIPHVETAIQWYDKVIKIFPKSAASRIAYHNKMRTLLGWEDIGRYGEKHGIRKSYDKYMPQLLKTFELFESDHPNDTALQAFRFQIAQVYWKNKDWGKTREWLKIIIEKSGEEDSFYTDLAKRRLMKVEY